MKTSYRYPLLPAGHIRLLKLQPRNPEDPIICSLSSALLTDSPVYEAVSYAWGEDNCARLRNIVLDGSSFLIHENLWQFLYHKRHRTESSTLWVDAISIDQRNVRERNSQVQRMGDIYRAARRVLVWLGPAGDDSDLAMEFIQKANLQHPLSHKKEAVYHALQRWLMRSYWARTWIIQEFVLAREITLLCGYKQIKQKQLERFWARAENFPDLERHGGLWGGLLSTQPYLLFQQRRSEERTPLHKLVMANSLSLCADPRDKVYAMLGLASDADLEGSIPVDYSKDPRALFGAVVSVCPISGADLLRFSKLLKLLLRIDSLTHTSSQQAGMGALYGYETTVQGFMDSFSLYSPHPESPPRPEFLTIEGFRTGKVICVDVLTNLHFEESQGQGDLTPAPSKPLQAGNLPEPSHGLGSLFYSGKVDDILLALGKFDLRRLYASPAMLQDISQRSFSHQNTDMQGTATGHPEFSLLVASFYRDSRQERMIGLAYGNVSKGDRVVQFLGYDIAFTVSKSRDSHISSQRLTSRMVCVDQNGSWEDTMTGQNYQYAGLNGGAEDQDAESKVDLRVTPEELLTLLC